MPGATTRCSVVIDAPLEQVWRITNTVEAWPELFVDEYSRVEVLERDDRSVRIRLSTVPDESGTVWEWESVRELDEEARTVTARRVTPGWFEHMQLRWTYEQLEDGVLMTWRQDFHLRDGAPVSDEEMARRITVGSTEQMRHIRDAIESGEAAALVAGTIGATR